MSKHPSPTSGSDKIHDISNGEKVFVIDRANGWILVEDENYTLSGWIKQQNISKTKPVLKKEEIDTEETSSFISISVVSGLIGAFLMFAGFGLSGVKDGRTKTGYKVGKEPKKSDFKLLFWGLLLMIIAYLFA